jgi:tRNA (guanine-N1)-methyltransferase
MSPQGERLGEELVKELRSMDGLVVIAGRYEGIDERLVERWSIARSRSATMSPRGESFPRW